MIIEGAKQIDCPVCGHPMEINHYEFDKQDRYYYDCTCDDCLLATPIRDTKDKAYDIAAQTDT